MSTVAYAGDSIKWNCCLRQILRLSNRSGDMRAESFSAMRRATMGYRNYFGFQKEPFAQDLRVEDLYPAPSLQAATERFLYGLELGAVSIVTGDVGSGQSTALRYAARKLN